MKLMPAARAHLRPSTPGQNGLSDAGFAPYCGGPRVNA
jgi:hypothetical protein